MTSAYKIVQLTLIGKKLDNTTVKLFESWGKEIELLKSLRDGTDKEKHKRITERINELRNMVMGLAGDRNKPRDDVVGMFPATAQRIFAHSRVLTSKSQSTITFEMACMTCFFFYFRISLPYCLDPYFSVSKAGIDIDEDKMQLPVTDAVDVLTRELQINLGI